MPHVHYQLILPDSEAWNEALLTRIGEDAVNMMALSFPLTEWDADLVRGGAILGATQYLVVMTDLGLLK